ncbi:hypothetical protein B2G71_10535 [Novosphingobium sp. PC22D]|uniref:alpha/beta fold hydrolase n=1 Tax=Novosphingobium sp. PC22D TaxID=1962403 RepID=UPI000BFB0B30|nr:alpha/beta hydrolase [Novosphingobium sp. PC22D]PEQ12730.1 hypothetical protein B2G71_10535 [Novosphingobium sp. PC22D]
MKLVFVHGWGFGADFWDRLRARLPRRDHAVEDRGYFGDPRPVEWEGPCVAVVHSFGAMRLLSEPPASLHALIAINGFDRFVAGEGFPGVDPRTLDAMMVRFGRAPEKTLRDFRSRCGTCQPFGPIRAEILGADLARMRSSDLRYVIAGLDIPMLSLQAADDQIVPAAMRAEAFAGSEQLERRVHPSAGHLLPLDDPAWCAAAISEFLENT